MKIVKYFMLAVFSLCGVAVLAQTNSVPPLPGLTSTGQVDVVSLINLLILGLTPVLTQAFKKFIPKLPDFSLNLLAPVLGAGIGWVLHKTGVDVATGWGAAIWGGLGTWLYELSANLKDALNSRSTTPSTPPSTPAP